MPHRRSALLLYIGVFHFAHRFQLLEMSRRSLEISASFKYVVINAIFIVAFYTGDITLNRLNAHTASGCSVAQGCPAAAHASWLSRDLLLMS